MLVLLAALGAVLCSAVVMAAPADVYTVFTNSSNHWDAQTTIEFPNTTAFESATDRWNLYMVPTYSVAITPATEADVAQAVCRMDPHTSAPIF